MTIDVIKYTKVNELCYIEPLIQNTRKWQKQEQ